MAIGILLISAAILVALGNAASIGSTNSKVTEDCTSKIYCEGPLLQTVQLAEIFNDSKTFVDLFQKNDPQITLINFNKLMAETNNEPNRTQVNQFVLDNFSTESELDNYTLPDWQENPPILKTIEDPNLQKWAKELNEVWKKLARKIKPMVSEHPERHSLIYVDKPFVVPGGRFKEFYYWDSYWVIEGLLICGMTDTARGMIDNFLSMVERFGFIPNGGRVYYLMRSHPPLLIPMVKMYLEYTQDYEYLNEIIGTLEKEFDFWVKRRMIDVDKNGKTYRMAHYVINSPRPRPESYKEDYYMGQKFSDVDKQASFYNDLKAGAESGWDFSGRWFVGSEGQLSNDLINIHTQNIIPVDLNSFLQQNARTLVKFMRKTNNVEKISYYANMAKKFQESIDEVLWNNEFNVWMDYDLKNQRHRTSFYPTNLAPLYTLSYDANNVQEIALGVVSYLKKSGIHTYFGGTPASLNQTGEQWDFPNAWPPLQSIMIQGLYRTQVTEAVQFSSDLARRWLESNYIGFEATGKMFEKYDATSPGKGGGGGEYNVQEGFGWTNGIVFEFLKTFPDMKMSNNVNNDEQSPVDINNNALNHNNVK